MAQKHGYATVEEFKNDAQNRFSLLETGIIDKSSTRLLLINVGMETLLVIWEVLISFTGNNGWVDADWRLYVAAWAWETEGSKVSNAFISNNGKDPNFFADSFRMLCTWDTLLPIHSCIPGWKMWYPMNRNAKPTAEDRSSISNCIDNLRTGFQLSYIRTC